MTIWVRVKAPAVDIGLNGYFLVEPVDTFFSYYKKIKEIITMISPTGNSIYLAINTFEAGTVYFQSENLNFFKTMHKTRNYVTVLNLCSLAYSFQSMGAIPIPKIIPFLETDKNYFFLFIIYIAGTLIFVRITNNYFSANDNRELTNWPRKCQISISPQELSTISVKRENSDYQTTKQWIQAMQLVPNIAMTCLSNTPYLYATCAALQLYSFFKISQWKQIKFTRTFQASECRTGFQQNLTEGCPIEYLVSYNYSMISSKKESDSVECSICFEPKPQTQFCTNHFFHPHCILGSIYGKSKDFIKEIEITRKISSAYVKEFDMGDEVSYDISIPKTNLPSCPCCRNCPEHNEFKIKVLDHHPIPKQRFLNLPPLDFIEAQVNLTY